VVFLNLLYDILVNRFGDDRGVKIDADAVGHVFQRFLDNRARQFP